MVRQNLPISTVSQSMSKFKTQDKELSASHGQFFAERPYIDMNVIVCVYIYTIIYAI